MAQPASNRGLLVAGVMLVVALALAFVGLVSVGGNRIGQCPPVQQSSPSAPIGPQCLPLPTVHGAHY